MPTPNIKIPTRFEGWREWGIEPPKTEVEEAKLVERLEAEANSTKRKQTSISNTNEKEPSAHTEADKQLRRLLTPTVSSLCLAVFEGAIEDSQHPDKMTCKVEWDGVRDFMFERANEIHAELHNANPFVRFHAAKIVSACCRRRELPDGGYIQLFNHEGENPFAQMLERANYILKSF